MRRASLRKRLTLVLALLVAVPLLAAAIVVAIVVPNTLRAQAENDLSAARGATTAWVSGACERAALAARAVGLQTSSVSPEAAVETAVREAGADYAAVLRADGSVVASAGMLPANVDAGAAAVADCSSDPPQDSAGLGALLVARVPIDIEASPELASVIAAVELSQSDLQELQDTLGTAAGMALLSQGRIAVSTLPTEAAEAAVTAVDLGAEIAEANAQVVDNWLVLAAPPTPGQPFTVVTAARPPTDAGLRWVVLGIVVAAIAVAVLVANWLAESLTRPLDELTAAAERVAAGDLETVIPSQGGDEVGRLSASFNNMTAALRLSMTALERGRDEMRESLLRLGEALSRTHDLEGICHVVLETAVFSTSADAGAVLLATRADVLELAAVHGLPAGPDRPAPIELSVGDGVLGSVAQAGLSRRGRLGQDAGRSVAAEPASGQVLAVALQRKHRPGGVLAVYRFGSEGFDSQDESTLRTLANQAGVAVDNALLHVEAERLSRTDALTGVANYRSLTLVLGREVERATRYRRALSVLMLDIDMFKAVNDAHGHERGNAVLREVASRLRAQVRDVDTVARYGGEEFTFVLPETDSAGAVRVAERLCTAVRRSSVQAGDVAVPLTVSIGVAVFPEHGVSAATLVAAADEALYRAKRAGRDRWEVAGEAAAAPTPAGTTER